MRQYPDHQTSMAVIDRESNGILGYVTGEREMEGISRRSMRLIPVKTLHLRDDVFRHRSRFTLRYDAHEQLQMWETTGVIDRSNATCAFFRWRDGRKHHRIMLTQAMMSEGFYPDLTFLEK